MSVRLLAAAALGAAFLSTGGTAAHAACVVGTVVCYQSRDVAGVNGPWCIYGNFGPDGHYQTVWC